MPPQNRMTSEYESDILEFMEHAKQELRRAIDVDQQIIKEDHDFEDTLESLLGHIALLDHATESEEIRNLLRNVGNELIDIRSIVQKDELRTMRFVKIEEKGLGNLSRNYKAAHVWAEFEKRTEREEKEYHINDLKQVHKHLLAILNRFSIAHRRNRLLQLNPILERIRKAVTTYEAVFKQLITTKP